MAVSFLALSESAWFIVDHVLCSTHLGALAMNVRRMERCGDATSWLLAPSSVGVSCQFTADAGSNCVQTNPIIAEGSQVTECRKLVRLTN